MDNSEKVERMLEIKEEIKDLVSEVVKILRDAEGSTLSRAKAYWIPHIKMALDKDHGYLGGSMVTMQDTINELDDDYESDPEGE